MFCKRIIPCLDVMDGRVVKGINFMNLKDAGDPVELAKTYYQEGADELVFLDVSASVNEKKTAIEIAKNVAREVFIPFTIGGGIRTVSDIEALLKAGADKVSISTAAVADPSLLQKASYEFGSQAIVLSLDVKMNRQGGWSVYTKSASENSQLDAVNWAKKAAELGAGEILLNSIGSDGTKNGFDITLNRTVSEAVNVPVIASGGAGCEEDFLQVFQKTKVSAALAASVFHFGKIRINSLKSYLQKNGVDVRV